MPTSTPKTSITINLEELQEILRGLDEYHGVYRECLEDDSIDIESFENTKKRFNVVHNLMKKLKKKELKLISK